MSDASSSSRSGGARSAGEGGTSGSGANDEESSKQAQVGKEALDGQTAADEGSAEPVKKKPREGKSRLAKRDEGKLSKFVSMPLDILTEIACHLDPLTLLHMSRSSKAFHAISAAPSSRPIWHAARKNVDLPDLEANDLSEMAYAALMFEKVCHVCGKDRASIIDFHVRKRFCKKCQHENLEPNYWVSTMHKDLTLHAYLFECCFSTTKTANKTRRLCAHFFTADLFGINAELFAIQSRITAKYRDFKFSHESLQVLKPFREAPNFPAGHAEFKPEEKELEEFVEQRRALVAAARADALILEEWILTAAANREQAARDAKDKRLEAILEKIESLGYERLDLNPWHSDIAAAIDQPRPLTEAIWKRISSTIIEHVEENRERRQEREKQHRRIQAKNLLSRRYYQLRNASSDIACSREHFPSFEAFLQLPSILLLWQVDYPPIVHDDCWATIALTASTEAQDAVMRFKIGIAKLVARTVAGTAHDLDSSLSAKLLPPQDANDSRTPTISKDEITSVFNQYRHHVTCGECISNYLSAAAHDLPSLSSHVVIWHDRLDPPRATADATWFAPNWPEVASSTLSLIGLPCDTGGTEALKALEEVGHRWKCEGCSPFERLFDFQKRSSATRGDDTTPFGFLWSSMVSHILRFHLHNEPPSKPILHLANPPVQDQPALIAGLAGSPTPVSDDGCGHDDL
ncbi:hypothetical protein JCM11251_002485 [Rhodosporidiobolus azoricus]